MQYLMLIIDDEDDGDVWLPEDADFAAWVADAEARGVRVGGNRLKPRGEATIVRRRGEKLLVTDGPLSESKEWIAGYDVLETGTLEEAIEVASLHPRARTGRVEVRPTWPLEFGGR